MTFFGNLILKINNSTLLFNLVSFRRRILSDWEEKHISSMLNKGQSIYQFNDEEKIIYSTLLKEKQILTDESIRIAEKRLEQYFIDLENEQSESKKQWFAIQITDKCNMRCSYCYERKYEMTGKVFSEEQLNNISKFYDTISCKVGQKISDTPTNIEITGGETLFDDTTVELINKIASKWPNTQLSLFTNGLNLIKYKNMLPVSNIDEFYISLDGTEKVHLKRVFGEEKNSSLYDSIIKGIKWALTQGKKVKINTLIDKNSYREIACFNDFLDSEGLLSNKLIDVRISIVNDFSNPQYIDEEFNNDQDILEIKDYFYQLFGTTREFFPDIKKLSDCILRDFNSEYKYRNQKCFHGIGQNYFFSPDGNVYFCRKVANGKGIVGTFYPEISVNYNLIDKLKNRNIYNNSKCAKCLYKFLCLGGCPLKAISQDKDEICGTYMNDEIMNKLSYRLNERDYNRAFVGGTHEVDKQHSENNVG